MQGNLACSRDIDYNETNHPLKMILYSYNNRNMAISSQSYFSTKRKIYIAN